MINADTVGRIAAVRADGYPVVSLYVSARPELPDLRVRVGNLLHQIRPLVGDSSLSRAARSSLRTDLTRIELLFGQDLLRSGAVAVFACAERGLFEKVTLPRPVRDRIVVDGKPWVRPLVALLDEYPRYGVVLVTRGASRVWELSRGDLRDRHGPDAWPEGFDVLLVGGHRPDVSGYVAALPGAVGARVAGTFSADPATATTDEIRRQAIRLADDHDRTAQLRRVAEVFAVYDAGGLAALGLSQCLQAGSIGAVRTLVVEDQVSAAGVVCEACGWLGLCGRSCAACECPVRQSDDIIDELVESVIDQGGSVRRVRVDSPLRGWTAAASLRFSLHVDNIERAEIVTSGQVG